MKKILLLLSITFLVLSQSLYPQWSLQNSGTDVTLYSVYFVHQNLGWATGWVQQSFGKVILTTNGGLNWNSQSIGIQYPFHYFLLTKLRVGLQEDGIILNL